MAIAMAGALVMLFAALGGGAGSAAGFYPPFRVWWMAFLVPLGALTAIVAGHVALLVKGPYRGIGNWLTAGALVLGYLGLALVLAAAIVVAQNSPPG